MKNKYREFWKLLKTYRYKSLFLKYFTVIMCVFFIISVLNGFMFYLRMHKNVTNELKNANQHILSRVGDMGNNTLTMVEDIATNIAVQSSVQFFVLAEDVNDARTYETEIAKYIHMYTLTCDYIDSIYISSESTHRITSGNGLQELKSYPDSKFLEGLEGKNELYITSRKKRDKYPNLITIVRPITINGTINKDDKVLGLVTININSKKFGEMIDSANDSQWSTQTVIADDFGMIIYSSQSEQIGINVSEYPLIYDASNDEDGITQHKKQNNMNYIISNNKLDYGKLKIYSIMPSISEKYIYNQTLQYVLGSFLLGLLAGFIAALLIAYFAYLPIMNIAAIFKEPNTDMLSTKEKSGEMKFIIENITQNLKKNSEIEKELKERITILRHATFVSLQSQINPHFIYNTLENINWLAVRFTDTENEVSSSILLLAKIMRYSIETDGYFVSFEDEIKYSKMYVELLKIRYPNIFDAYWDIPDEILKYKTIRMSLQPILENAIQHGIRPKRAKGNIYIKAIKNEETIVLSVADSGIGMTDDEINSLNMQLCNNYKFETKHIGLQNVNQRLRVLFGENYGVSIKKREDNKCGICVEILIPAIDTEFDYTENF